MQEIITTLLNETDLVSFNTPKLNSEVFRYESGKLIKKTVRKIDINIQYSDSKISLKYNISFFNELEDKKNFIVVQPKEIGRIIDNDERRVYIDKEALTFNIAETIVENLSNKSEEIKWFLTIEDAKADYNSKVFEEMDNLKNKMV